jgi:cobalt-zinc-cadmium efflux system outer membrane protein
MGATKRLLARGCLLLSFCFPLACTSLRPSDSKAARTALPPLPAEIVASPNESKAIQKVSHDEPAGDTLPAPRAEPSANVEQPADLFAGIKELSVDGLIQTVLNRNPTLPEMVAAWKAAQARYPQVTSLDDPFFGTTLAPASLGVTGPGDSSGYRMEIFQRYPFPGKLKLRGQKAMAEADAAGRDVENTRVQLIESAREAFYDYFLAFRQLEVNDEGLDLLRKYRKEAEIRYTNGKSETNQEMLQADVEIGRQEQRLIGLKRLRAVSAGRLNSLMHLPPFSPLPPPPETIPVPEEMPDPQQLLSTALNQRVDLLALKDRIAAADAAVKIAQREYYPDFDVMAAYDHFWTEQQQRPQLAVRINLPVRLQRRAAALLEAQQRLTQLKAQYAQQTDVVGFEVRQVYEQLQESKRTVELYERTVIPAARNNVKSAQGAYGTGKIPFLSLITALRELVDLRDRYYEAVAELFRRRTVLERALSGSPSATPIPTSPRLPGPGQAGYPTSMGTIEGP